MRDMTPSAVPASRFCQRLVEQNKLGARQFAQWAFHPGMLFHSRQRWWGNGGFRNRPHEGIDLCLFIDQAGSVQILDRGAQIPAIYGGTVKTVIDDYLGKTIFIAHDIYDGTGTQLYTIYGHLEPRAGLAQGALLAEDENVGCISGIADRRLPIIPHVHISVAWIPEKFPPERLTWKMMNDSPEITLLNPLAVLSCHYMTIAERTFPLTLPF